MAVVLPAGHISQEVAPITEEYSPCMHRVHSFAAVTAEYDPTGHLVHFGF